MVYGVLSFTNIWTADLMWVDSMKMGIILIICPLIGSASETTLLRTMALLRFTDFPFLFLQC